MGLLDVLKSKKKIKSNIPSGKPDVGSPTKGSSISGLPFPDTKHIDREQTGVPPLPTFDNKVYPQMDSNFSELKASEDHKTERIPVSIPSQQRVTLPEPQMPVFEESFEPINVEPVQPIFHNASRGNYRRKEAPIPETMVELPQEQDAVLPPSEQAVVEQSSYGEPIPNSIPPLADVPEYEETQYLNTPTKYEKQVKQPILRDIPAAPIFLPLKEYHEILHTINSVVFRLKELNNVDAMFSDTKVPADTQFGKWHESLEEIERKLLYVDKLIFDK